MRGVSPNRKSCRQLLELEPGFLWTRSYSLSLPARGARRMPRLRCCGRNPTRNRLCLPIMLQANGRMAEADEALKALIARWADREAYYVAMTYAYRGDHDLALQWLERAYQQKDTSLKDILGEPRFKNLAGDPRYKALLRKMKLPET